MDTLFDSSGKGGKKSRDVLAIAREGREDWSLWRCRGRWRKKWKKLAEGSPKVLAREYNKAASGLGLEMTSAKEIEEAARSRQVFEDGRDALIAKSMMRGLGGGGF